jgi:uncharacterized membrane protein (UPF0127 family)
VAVARTLARVLTLALLATWAGCAPEVPDARLPIETLVVGNTQITAELAATREDRARGLMFRESLPEDHGMLFLHPVEAHLAFWMKNTPLPLSIAFADAGGQIVRIADMEPYSEQLIHSGAPVRYALEMNRGWFERHGVFVGDAIRGIPRLPVE